MVLPPSSPSSPLTASFEVPGHEHLVRFFGVRLRLVVAIVAAGVFGGLAGALYLEALDLVTQGIGPHRWGSVGQIVALAGVGVLVAVLVRVLGRPADVELLVDNIHLPDMGDGTQGEPARLRSLIPVSLLCIGAGGTLGPEAPVVTTGGTVSHRMARGIGLQPDDVRVVTLTGMAAGFAVLFGAPLGAALFALEIPHRRGIGYHEAAVPACIGAVIGYAISTALGGLGLGPIWELPLIDELVWIDLVWAVLAGIVGAGIAVAFTMACGLLRRLAQLVPGAARPAVGGALLGALAIVSPYALTNGEHQVDVLVGAVGIGTLVVAASIKLLAAGVAVTTGWRGGFIIPLFFVGFCVGRAISPSLPGATEWAFVVGVMIAANVGVTKTPLGSAAVVTEMAGLPVLPSALIASLTSLVLTSPIALIEAQRDRIDAYGSSMPATSSE